MSGLTKHFYYNCDMGHYTIPGTSGTVRCDVRSDNISGVYTLCRPDSDSSSATQTHTIMFKGNGFGIIKACTYNDMMHQVCDQKYVQLTVQ